MQYNILVVIKLTPFVIKKVYQQQTLSYLCAMKEAEWERGECRF
jgi:hypothetical protein